jgi:alpha-glucosidase
VDGFRVDVAHGMCKRAGLPDVPDDPGAADPRFDDDAVHDVHRMIRATLDHYPGRVAVGALAVPDDERFARYLRADELHLCFDFRLLRAPFDAAEVRAAIEGTLAAVAAVGAPATWLLSDHDVPRPVSRYGGGPVGLARARAMALVEMALPGAVFLYNGEELGLPDAEPPSDAVRDGSGRDSCRVPLPWEDGPPGFGFTVGTPWLPVPDGYARLSAAAQLEDTGSTLSLFRRALELRRAHPGFTGEAVEWFGAPPGCLAFRRAGTTLVCALNASPVEVPLPPGNVLLASGRLEDDLLPPDTAAWLA